jgi:hypothetical protein
MELWARKLLRSQVLTSLALGCLLSPGFLAAQNLTVIGGTSFQKQLTACIEQFSADDLDRLPGSDHSMTIVILEHKKFMQVKDSFGAYRTKLAFSNLATRRMYLSSDVFRDMDTTLRCIPHELGHSVTRSIYEGNAEIAAGRIRTRARQVCTMQNVPDPPRILSHQTNSLRTPAGTE